MQTSRSNYRARGYRESRTLVDLGKAATSDVTRLRAAQQDNEQTALALRDAFEQARETDVSRVQHLRAQLAYYLRNNT